MCFIATCRLLVLNMQIYKESVNSVKNVNKNILYKQYYNPSRMSFNVNAFKIPAVLAVLLK